MAENEDTRCPGGGKPGVVDLMQARLERDLERHLRSFRLADCAQPEPDVPDELRDRLGSLRLEDYLSPQDVPLVKEAHADRLARVRRIMRKIKRALRGLDDQVEAVHAIVEEELLRRA